MNRENAKSFHKDPEVDFDRLLDTRVNGDHFSIDLSHLDGASQHTRSIADIDISGCTGQYLKFERCTFTRTLWQKSDFVDCRFVDCRFVGCRFQEANFSRSEFLATTFVECNLFELTFFDCQLSDISISNCEVEALLFNICPTMTNLHASDVHVVRRGALLPSEAAAPLDANTLQALEALGVDVESS